MYEWTAFYVYKAIFMVELLLAEILMSSGLKRRPLFALRLSLCCAACVGVAFALPVAAYNAFYCSIVFIVMFIVTLPMIKICYECNWVSVIFRGIAAYTTQHMAYQIFDTVMVVIGMVPAEGSFASGGAYGDETMSDFLPIIMHRAGSESILSYSPVWSQLITLLGYSAYAFVYIATYTLSYRFVSSRLKHSDKFEMKGSSMLVFVVLFVLFNVVITSVVTYYSEGVNYLYAFLVSGYNIACCFFTMYLMFEVIFQKQLERGYTIANRLLRQAGEQYALAKENIELINLKCHDLKHQIRAVSANSSGGDEAIAEIEKMISIYDAGIRTGNEALDIILTEKSLYCNKHNIRLYCIVDGKLLGFMSDADLYSLFGNLLDNAIEAVDGMDEDKRFVNLSVRDVNGFTRISAVNCLDRPLTFDGGLPSTTKADKESHGYGMKSIRLICKKYNGELDVSARDGMFRVNMIFIH